MAPVLKQALCMSLQQIKPWPGRPPFCEQLHPAPPCQICNQHPPLFLDTIALTLQYCAPAAVCPHSLPQRGAGSPLRLSCPPNAGLFWMCASLPSSCPVLQPAPPPPSLPLERVQQAPDCPQFLPPTSACTPPPSLLLEKGCGAP